MTDTIVTFADGTTTGTGVVVHAESHPAGALVILDRTPFHPVDHTWPDQPADTGTITASAQPHVVVDAVMAAREGDGPLLVGAEIPVKRGAEGWSWLVAHRLTEQTLPDDLTIGASIIADVDAVRRAGLSRGHTACHLASLALDGAVAHLWRKDPGVDALGAPNFEGRANQSSRINEDGAVDEYRLGKSLRKAGFDTDTFAATLSDIEARVNATLADWIATDGTVEVITEGETIADRRSWRCVLPEGEAIIACGGTHAHSLGELRKVEVSLHRADAQTLTMITRARTSDQ